MGDSGIAVEGGVSMSGIESAVVGASDIESDLEAAGRAAPTSRGGGPELANSAGGSGLEGSGPAVGGVEDDMSASVARGGPDGAEDDDADGARAGLSGRVRAGERALGEASWATPASGEAAGGTAGGAGTGRGSDGGGPEPALAEAPVGELREAGGGGVDADTL